MPASSRSSRRRATGRRAGTPRVATPERPVVAPKPSPLRVVAEAGESPVTAWAGAVAATLALVWTLWLVPAAALYISRQPSWTGIEAFAAAFSPGAYMAWLVPTLLLAPTFAALMAVVDLTTRAKTRVWGRLALTFGLIYAAILAASHWLQYAVVIPALMAGELQGLSWLVMGGPFSVAVALEGLGYSALGLATLFAGLSFSGDRPARAVHWLLVVNGAGGALGFLVGPLAFPVSTYVALAVWGATFAIAMALLAVRYARQATSARVPR